MRAHGVLGDEEPLRDLVRPEVLVEEEQHLDLTRREHARDLLGHAAEPSAFAHPVEQPSRDTTGQRRIASRDTAEEYRDLLGRLGLEEVAGGTAADRREEVLLRVGCGQDHDLGRGGLLADVRERREAVHPRHRQVEQDDVRVQLDSRSDRGRAVLGLADDVEPLLREKRRKGVARQRMIVHDEDAIGHLSLIGTRSAADK